MRVAVAGPLGPSEAQLAPVSRPVHGSCSRWPGLDCEWLQVSTTPIPGGRETRAAPSSGTSRSRGRGSRGPWARCSRDLGSHQAGGSSGCREELPRPERAAGLGRPGRPGWAPRLPLCALARAPGAAPRGRPLPGWGCAVLLDNRGSSPRRDLSRRPPPRLPGGTLGLLSPKIRRSTNRMLGEGPPTARRKPMGTEVHLR